MNRTFASTSIFGGIDGDESGMGLLDVVIALLVLMVMILPIANVIATGGKITSSYQEKLTAETVAAGALNQTETNLSSDTAAPPELWSAGSYNGTTTVATWPTVAAVTDTIGSISYKVFEAGGWCAGQQPGSGPTVWTNGTPSPTTVPVEFYMAVKVVWGSTSSSTSTNDVVMHEPLTTQAGWISPTDIVPTTTTTANNNLSVYPSGTGTQCPADLS